jgi:hypothetical protein
MKCIGKHFDVHEKEKHISFGWKHKSIWFQQMRILLQRAEAAFSLLQMLF